VGRARTGALVGVDAAFPIVGGGVVAIVARARVRALGVGAQRVGTAVVEPSCDRGAASVSSSVALKRGRAIQHTASTTLCLGGPVSRSIDYGRS
jgi:hypothetical protein